MSSIKPKLTLINQTTESIEQILAAREQRTLVLFNRLKQPLIGVTLTLNLPGSVKTTPASQVFFRHHYEQVTKILEQEFQVEDTFFWLDFAGEIGYFLLNSANPYEVKKVLLGYEKSFGARGQLLDLDVYPGINQKITRTDVGEPRRQCFLCACAAKECAVNQKHLPAELAQFVCEHLVIEPNNWK